MYLSVLLMHRVTDWITVLTTCY